MSFDETIAAHIADHEVTVEAGIHRETEKARLNAQQAADRFVRWLDSMGTSLDGVSEAVGRGRRRLPSSWVVGYAQQIARPGLVKRASHRQEVTNLMAGLRAWKVDVTGWDDPDVRAAVKRTRAVLDIGQERPAQPVLVSDGTLEAIAAAIDELDMTEVQRAALGAMHALGFWGGGRASELVRHLRWRHIEVSADRTRLLLTWPAGCKFQDEDVTLARGTGLVCDPLDALTRLRDALAAAGLEPGPDDAILPGWIDGELVLTPCENIPAAYRRAHGVHAPAMMRERVTAWYRMGWDRAATTAGLAPTATRRVSLHGLRRGLATAAALAGVPVTVIQCELRHGDWVITLRYTDEERIDMASVIDLIEVDDGVSPVDAVAVAALASGTRPAGGIDDGRCVVVDDLDCRCPRAAATFTTEWGQVCYLHLTRIRGGWRVTRPVRPTAFVDDDNRVDPLEAGLPDVEARDCAAPGCPNPVVWRRNLGGEGLSWLCQHHARAQALDPDGRWERLLVCDGIGCDLTYGQRRAGEPFGALMSFDVGDRVLRVCSRCWSAARVADDPADLTSWARREVLGGRPCAFCTDGTEALGWIPEGDRRSPVCDAHRRRWYISGKPPRLADDLRMPIERRRMTDLASA